MAGRSGRGNGRLDVALLAAAVLGSVVALAMPEASAEQTAGFLRRTVLYPLMSLQEGAERTRRAIERHDAVTRADDSVAMRALDAMWLAEENAQLRALLSLGPRLSWRYVAAGVLHGPQPGEPHTLVLRAGTDAGVAAFNPVITPSGVVGYIRSVDAATSVAVVWPHPDFRVSVITSDGGGFGVVAPHADAPGAPFMLELRGVPFRAPLDSGTAIVSSGFGGTFPRGVPVGTVLREIPTTSSWERTYLLVPAVRPVDIGTVLVLTSRSETGDLSGVWAARDSAGVGR